MRWETLGWILEFPLAIFAVSIVTQCLAAWAGYHLRPRGRPLEPDRLSDLDTAHVAALTLLALVIAFTFSMAATRYDQRKNYEEAEANAIGTEYSRTDLLPPSESVSVKALLKAYIDQRILFYITRDQVKLRRIDAETMRLQGRLWSSAVGQASETPTLFRALAVAGMNDVINSEGYTHAAWLNRIPVAAWMFMELVAVTCNLLLGYRFKGTGIALLLMFPTISAISFFVIADIDNPRNGVIQVVPQNLILAAQAMK